MKMQKGILHWIVYWIYFDVHKSIRSFLREEPSLYNLSAESIHVVRSFLEELSESSTEKTLLMKPWEYSAFRNLQFYVFFTEFVSEQFAGTSALTSGWCIWKIKLCYRVTVTIEAWPTMVPERHVEDEVHFWLHGIVSTKNNFIWETWNPHEHLIKPLNPPHVTVWFDFTEPFITGPFFNSFVQYATDNLVY